MNIKRYNQMNESDDRRLDMILDKISRFGIDNLSKPELDYLSTQKSTQSNYNGFIIRLLEDLSDGEINTDIFKKFIKEHIKVDELADFLVQLYVDKRLDFLIKIK